jgi:hypothetical protein
LLIMAPGQDTALKVSPGPHERDKVGRVDGAPSVLR